MLKTRSTLHKVNQEAYAILFERLVRWPADCPTLAELSGLHEVTVRDLMRVFYRRGVVFIAGWRADRLDRDTTPVYALKLKPTDKDVPRRRKTPAERAADYKARKKLKEAHAARAGDRSSNSKGG